MFPRPLINYLVYFHSIRDYFECHEILEEYWKKENQSNKLWVGFIQLAVAMYHHRRNNFLGAEKQLLSAMNIFEHEIQQLTTFGFAPNQLLNLLNNQYEAIKKRAPYCPINLPIASEDLLNECIKKSQEKGLTWGVINKDINIEIIDKHKLRDRSSIINERIIQLKKRHES